MHTPGPWTIRRRPTREGECGPGLWISGPNHQTVCDTGAFDAFPLKQQDKDLIEQAPVMAELLALIVEGEDLMFHVVKAQDLLAKIMPFA